MKAGYAASGLRAWKEVGGAKTYFLYDGLFPICEINASGSVTATNVYGPDGLIARKSGTTWTYYSFDQQGNLALRTNASGTVLSHHKSDAFGVHWESAANADPFAYNAQSGYYLDRETGLYLCGFRYYDPVNARWLNRDPIGFEGGINLYGYCQQNPVGWVDPSGLRRSGLDVCLVTGNWEADDVAAEAGFAQAWTTFARWGSAFGARNQQLWGAVAGAGASATLPFAPSQKSPNEQLPGSLLQTSVARRISIWCSKKLGPSSGISRLASRMAMGVKSRLVTKGPVRGVGGPLLVAVAYTKVVLAWSATTETMNNPNLIDVALIVESQ